MRRHMLFLADMALVAVATLATIFLIHDLALDATMLRREVPNLILTLSVAAPILLWLGLNQTIWRMSATPDYARAAMAGCLIATFPCALASVLRDGTPVDYATPVLQALLLMMALVGIRVLARLRHSAAPAPTLARTASAQGAASSPRVALIVGLSGIGARYVGSIGEIADGRLAIAGILGPSRHHIGGHVQQCEVLGRPEAAERVIADLSRRGIVVTDLIVATAIQDLSRPANAALQALEERGVRVDRLVDRVLSGGAGARRPPLPESFFRKPDLLETFAARPYWRWKRLVDRLAACLLVAAVLPVLLVVSLLVAFDVGAPLMFWQQRPGHRGQPMTVHKFRTMGRAHRNGVRIPDSERLSLVGRFLRASRLDELPQLWCILMGAMSFIGPRPLLPIDQPAMYAARLLVRPGLTGYAQVKGGRSISAADKAVLDVWYLKNASLWVDLGILLETVRMVVLGEREDQAAIEAAWADLQASGIVGDLAATTRLDQPAHEPQRVAA